MGLSNLSSGFRPGVCTSTTRPSAPFEGQMIYETDTDKVLVWDGSAWYPPKNTAWGVLGRHTLTTIFNTASPHNVFQDEGLSCSVSYGPSRLLKATLSVRPYTPGGQNFVTYRLLRGSTTILNWGNGYPEISNTEAPFKTLTYTFAGPATAATETFKIQIAGSANTQVTSYGQPESSDGPRQFIIEDVGPA